MKSFIFYFLILVTSSLFGQGNVKSSHFIINNSYPIPIGNNFMNDKSVFGDDVMQYVGIDACGIGYNYNVIGNFNIGMNLRYSYLLNKSKYITNTGNINSALTFNYNYLKGKFQFIPQINFGYSNFKFFQKDEKATSTSDLSINAFTVSSQMQVLYSLTNNLSLGISVAYDNTWLEKSDIVPNIAYNRNLQFLYPGICMDFKI
jgi:hypothetical protein